MILCSTFGFAQNVDKETYKKLEDYVRCKYVEFYLDKYYKEEEPNSINAKPYIERTKPILSRCTIENSLSSTELFNLIDRTAARPLVQEYNRKEKNQSIDALFWKYFGQNYSVDYASINKTIRTEIDSYLRSRKIQLNGDTLSTGIVIKQLPIKNDYPKEKSESFSGILFVWIIIIAFIVLAFYYRKLLMKYINVLTSFFRDRVFKKNEKNKYRDYQLKEELIFRDYNLEKALKEVKETLRTQTIYLEMILKEMHIKIDIQKNPYESLVEFENKESTSFILYADIINNRKFNIVKALPDEDTIFELKLDKPNSVMAFVTIHEKAYQKIKRRPEFLEGCKVRISGENAVIVSHEGIAQKDDGKWSITTPLEVEIN